MKMFEVGKTYTCRSACNHECIYTYTVVARTPKTITVREEDGSTKRLKIIKGLSEYNGAESVYPEGKYSMCPIIRA